MCFLLNLRAVIANFRGLNYHNGKMLCKIDLFGNSYI